jgi:DNA-binding FadR family transcriptional regulator
MARQTLQRDTLDAIGPMIISGAYVPGQILRTEDLENEHNVSRTVLRETLKVLESMHLIEMRRRIGITVRNKDEWNVFDPRVIRWRLSGSDRSAQLKSLTALRIAVEPLAAHEAAVNGTEQQKSDLSSLAVLLQETGDSGDLEAYLEHDIAFHTLVLRASGNEMFSALSNVVAEVLTGRTVHHLMPDHPHPQSRRFHGLVASCISDGNKKGAESAMRGLLTEVAKHVTYPESKT